MNIPNSTWFSFSKKQAFALLFLCGLYIVFRWGQIAVRATPQDFHIYYYAVVADQAGVNEYSPTGLKEVSGGLTKFLFVYPPYTKFVFEPFTRLDVKTAARVFLVIKTLVFAFLFLLWMKFLPPSNRGTHLSMMILLTAFGYYEATYTDFKNGNISVFEQFFLWTGLMCFYRAQYFWFSLLVIAASFFKLALIPFLGLLVFVPKFKGWAAFAFGLAAFCGLQLASYLHDPAEYMRFLGASSGLEEYGSINPSTMMLVREIFSFLGKPAGTAIYVLIATVISLSFLKLAWPKKEDKYDAFLLIIGYCFLYAIVMPRFKSYSFIMLLLPTYWMMQNWMLRNKWLAFAVTFFLVAHIIPYQTWAIAALMLYFWFVEFKKWKQAV